MGVGGEDGWMVFRLDVLVLRRRKEVHYAKRDADEWLRFGYRLRREGITDATRRAVAMLASSAARTARAVSRRTRRSSGSL